MPGTNTRIQRVIEELAGNESLLDKLETESAAAMLNWGISMAASVVEDVKAAEDANLDLALLPRLKTIRQTMRAVGNWAAGKYADSGIRRQLRDRLLANFRTIFGETARLPSTDDLDQVLNEIDDQNKTPQQMILKLRAMLETALAGESHA
jgi:hypothetical protein